jgi:hypothetical protein
MHAKHVLRYPTIPFLVDIVCDDEKQIETRQK